MSERTERTEAVLPDLLVRNANFFLLWAAYGVSAVGDHLSEMALLVERGGLGRPDATRVQALIQFGFFLPFVIFGPLAGWCADRFSRKATMIASDVLRAILIVNLSLIVPWLAGLGLEDYSIVLPLGVLGLVAAFFSPARQAMIPTLIRDDQLVRANAMINALGTIGTIVAALLGGYIVVTFGPVWNFRLNMCTFLLSALFVSFISLRRTRAVAHSPLAGVWTPVIDGFRYVFSHRRVWQMILLGTVFWAAAGVVISSVPAIARDTFGGDIQDASTFRGIIGVGLAVGAAMMTIFGQSLPMQTAVLVSLMAASFWIFALDVAYVTTGSKLVGAIGGWINTTQPAAGAATISKVLVGICLFGIGGAGAALLVTVMAGIQHFVPDSRRGRVFGVSDMTTMGAMVLATGAIGIPRFENLDRYIPWLLTAVGAGFVVVTVISWRTYRRGDVHPAALSVIWRISTFYAKWWCRVKRIGPCTLPRNGPVILASNHTAGIDPILIYATCRYRVISFLVEQKYYNVPVAHWFQKMVGCIPVDRENPSKSTIATMLKMLKDGGCLGIFPQGTFEKPGEDLGGKSGIGMIALRTGAAIVPCHISGTKYFDSVFRSFMTRHDVRIRYGKPIDLSAYAGRERDKAAQDEVAEMVMRRIKELAPVGGEPQPAVEAHA